jgi:hypothetical protein
VGNKSSRHFIVKGEITMERSTEINEITKKAMLVKMSIGVWSARKQDKAAEQTVQQTYETENDVVKVTKGLVPKEHINKVTSAAMRARMFHYQNTLPWSDDGYRILSVKNFDVYSKGIRNDIEPALQESFNEFIAAWKDIVKQSKKRLGKLWDEKDFPTDIKNKFKFKINIVPIPTANDFRVHMRQDEVKEIKEQINHDIKETLQEAQKDLYIRLYTVIEKMVERLNDPEAKFKNALIENICEVCDLIPKLQVIEDSELETLRSRIVKSICTVDPEDLRKNKDTRKKTVKAASGILKAMGGMYGKKN